MPILRFFYKFFFYFFSYPIYLYLKFKRIFLVAGMITSTGHTFQENHYFNLKKKYLLLPKNYKFLLITNHNHITEFSNKFLNYYDYYITNNYLDYFKDDLCKTYSDIAYYNHLSHFTLNKKKISWLKGFQKQTCHCHGLQKCILPTYTTSYPHSSRYHHRRSLLHLILSLRSLFFYA